MSERKRGKGRGGKVGRWREGGSVGGSGEGREGARKKRDLAAVRKKKKNEKDIIISKYIAHTFQDIF